MKITATRAALIALAIVAVGVGEHLGLERLYGAGGLVVGLLLRQVGAPRS